MFIGNKILYLFFALFVFDVYGMDGGGNRGKIIGQSSIIYLKENYPIVGCSEIKLDSRCNNKKIIIKFSDRQISKKIKKIKIFDGFAIITKKQKPAAAISCFDLAVICQYRRQDFMKKMQNQLSYHDPWLSNTLQILLDEPSQSLIFFSQLIAKDIGFLPYTNKAQLSMLFEAELGKIIGPKMGGRNLYTILWGTFERLCENLFEEPNSHQNVNLFNGFSWQLESLKALELDRKWDDGGKEIYSELCSKMQFGISYIVFKTIDEFTVDISNKNINDAIYFLWMSKCSNVQILSREIIFLIVEFSMKIKFYSTCCF